MIIAEKKNSNSEDSGNIQTIRLNKLHYRIRKKLKTHFIRLKSKDKIMSEMYNGWIKFNILMDVITPSGNRYRYPTSVTLKKNIVSLWLVMMEKVHCDHNREIIDFIQNVCLKRWKGDTAKGLGDFVLKCMLYSIMEHDDWINFKEVYKSLNGRVKNHQKIVNTKHGKGCIKAEIHKTSDPSQKNNPVQRTKNQTKRKIIQRKAV